MTSTLASVDTLTLGLSLGSISSNSPTGQRRYLPCSFDVTSNGEIVPLPQFYCRQLACFACVSSRQVPYLRDALRLVQPSHLMTISCIPPDQLVQFPAFIRSVRRVSGCKNFQYHKTVEQHRNLMLHAHLWVHGGVPSDDILTRLASTRGMGNVRTRKRFDSRGYSYTVKNFTDSPESLGVALQLNNGHLGSSSNGFFRDPGTGALTGGRDAAARLYRKRRDKTSTAGNS
jgi:hypothetical protein